MKIQAVDSNTKRPLSNAKIQLQVRGKDSGYLSLTTDATGIFQLDDKYRNQQIAATNGGAQGQWITASDKATLFVLPAGAPVGGSKDKTTTGSHGGSTR